MARFAEKRREIFYFCTPFYPYCKVGGLALDRAHGYAEAGKPALGMFGT